MSSSTPEVDQQAELLEKLAELHQHKTLLIASINDDGTPLISYAPFVEVAGVFYIFISYLADHTVNLLVRPQASVMLAADEAETNNLFLRARVRYEVDCSVVPREAESFDSTLEALETRHGKMVSLLKTLGDFYLIALEPKEGNLVLGAGAAYRFKPGTETFEQVRGR